MRRHRPFAELLNIYVRYLETERSSHTAYTYGLRIDKIMGHIGQGRINRESLNRCRNAMRAAGCSPYHISLCMGTLRSMFTWLHEHGYVHANPVPLFRGSRANRRLRRPITELEHAKLLDAAQNHPYWPYAMALGWDTGLRLCDVAQLRWASVRFDTQSLEVVPQKTQRIGKTVMIPLGASSITELFAMRDRFKDPVFVAPTMHEDYQAVQHRNISRQFLTLARRVGIAGKSFHSYRHAFVTRMIQQGVHTSIICAMTGHTLKELNTYTHIGLETIRAAVTRSPEAQPEGRQVA